MLEFWLWVGLAFSAGSLPFSPWLARWAVGRDVRQYGDGNPGATNVGRAGGWQLGLAAVLLDGFKSAIPIGVAYWWAGVRAGPLLAMGLAASLGHAYSPWLGGRGGKAVATTFGVWAGLTGPEIPTVLGCLLGLFFVLINRAGWALLCAMGGLLIYLLRQQADGFGLTLWAGQTLLFAWKYRADLRHPPGFKPEVLLWLHQKIHA